MFSSISIATDHTEVFEEESEGHESNHVYLLSLIKISGVFFLSHPSSMIFADPRKIETFVYFLVSVVDTVFLFLFLFVVILFTSVFLFLSVYFFRRSDLVPSLPLKKARGGIAADRGSGLTRPIFYHPSPWMSPPPPLAINQVRTKVKSPRDMPPPWKMPPHIDMPPPPPCSPCMTMADGSEVSCSLGPNL